MKNSALFWIIGSPLVVAAFGLAITGCHSRPETRDLMVEEAHATAGDRPVAMKGEGSFDDGKLHAIATVSRGFRRVGNGPAPKREHRRWGNRDTDAFTDDYFFGATETEDQQKEAVQEYVRQAMARRAAGSPMPPVTLRLTFENRGSEPMVIVPIDVNSDLGNFAARPKELTIAPGATGELDPMVSQLGVTNDVIPLTLTIRTGSKSETQVIQIKNVIAPAALKSATK
jgi:hypothetical protein